MSQTVNWKTVALSNKGGALLAADRAVGRVGDATDDLNNYFAQRTEQNAKNQVRDREEFTDQLIGEMNSLNSVDSFTQARDSGSFSREELIKKAGGNANRIDFGRVNEAVDGRLSTLENNYLRKTQYGETVRNEADAQPMAIWRKKFAAASPSERKKMQGNVSYDGMSPQAAAEMASELDGLIANDDAEVMEDKKFKLLQNETYSTISKNKQVIKSGQAADAYKYAFEATDAENIAVGQAVKGKVEELQTKKSAFQAPYATKSEKGKVAGDWAEGVTGDTTSTNYEQLRINVADALVRPDKPAQLDRDGNVLNPAVPGGELELIDLDGASISLSDVPDKILSDALSEMYPDLGISTTVFDTKISPSTLSKKMQKIYTEYLIKDREANQWGQQATQMQQEYFEKQKEYNQQKTNYMKNFNNNNNYLVPKTKKKKK